jgi:hypothetical protein
VESCCTLCGFWTPASVPACRLNTEEEKNLCQWRYTKDVFFIAELA